MPFHSQDLEARPHRPSASGPPEQICERARSAHGNEDEGEHEQLLQDAAGVASPGKAHARWYANRCEGCYYTCLHVLSPYNEEHTPQVSIVAGINK
jgi:hypothetical protein